MRKYGKLIYYFLKEVEVAVEEIHLLELQVVEAAIRAGLEMGIAMISTTIQTAPMMVEIAVDLMSIQNPAVNAYALKQEVEEAVELQHLLELQVAEAAIRAGLEMGIGTISTTIQTAPMMVEIVVQIMLMKIIATNACALNEF